MEEFDWNQARGFLAAAEAGSLSAAARMLGLTQPTLSRQVAALEARLGVTLFERVGNRLEITETGLDLLEHARQMGEAANLLALTASGRAQAIGGQVRITASDGMAAYVLPPVLAEIRAQAPEIEIDLMVSNAVRDLRRREADIAIRHVRPDQPDLIGRLVRETEAVLYVSQGWIARHGRPQTPEDVADKEFIGVEDTGRLIAAFEQMGLRLRRENFRLSTDNGVAATEMVRHGLGIGVMIRDLAAAIPDVEPILPQLAPIPVPIWLVTHRELNTSRRIRVVFDLLAEALKR
ncbi:LysR family transcriptional regulator [Oricola sp.]|uniref:LysR family transcriptional regulator n=1 Tax=Oricola sp. TaxID=1979950 RepID=UPI003BA8B9C3